MHVYLILLGLLQEKLVLDHSCAILSERCSSMLQIILLRSRG